MVYKGFNFGFSRIILPTTLFVCLIIAQAAAQLQQGTVNCTRFNNCTNTSGPSDANVEGQAKLLVFIFLGISVIGIAIIAISLCCRRGNREIPQSEESSHSTSRSTSVPRVIPDQKSSSFNKLNNYHHTFIRADPNEIILPLSIANNKEDKTHLHKDYTAEDEEAFTMLKSMPTMSKSHTGIVHSPPRTPRSPLPETSPRSPGKERTHTHRHTHKHMHTHTHTRTKTTTRTTKKRNKNKRLY